MVYGRGARGLVAVVLAGTIAFLFAGTPAVAHADDDDGEEVPKNPKPGDVEACKRRCDQKNKRDINACKKKYEDPIERKACYARANEKNGKCLRDCEKNEK
jgi:hypothetical protein